MPTEQRLTTRMFDNLGYYHPIVVHFPIVLTALDSIQPPKTSRTLFLNAAPPARRRARGGRPARQRARALLTALTADYATSARLRATLDSLR